MLNGVAVTDDLQKLFHEIADLDSAGRARYFTDHGVAAELRAEVESLLPYDSGSADALSSSVAATVEEFLGTSPEQFCGPYKLVRLLGEGGMGSVHLAQRQDGEVDLRVAVKLIRGVDRSR